MYKLYPLNPQSSIQLAIVERVSDSACIPFNSGNRDYLQFKKDIVEGKELKNRDGTQMSNEEKQTFIDSLP